MVKQNQINVCFRFIDTQNPLRYKKEKIDVIIKYLGHLITHHQMHTRQRHENCNSIGLRNIYVYVHLLQAAHIHSTLTISFYISIPPSIRFSLCRLSARGTLEHSYTNPKWNKINRNVMSFEEILFVFCSVLFCSLFCFVTKIYFWDFKTYLDNVFENADDSIQYKKALQTFFCKRRVIRHTR